MEAVRQRAFRTVEFGIYRDGDNNLDESQGFALRQALQTSVKDSRVEYTVEDTTSAGTGVLRTDTFTLADGGVSQSRIDMPHNMASAQNLATFVAHVLDEAQTSGVKQTWIELTDHGAGDGGGLQADSSHAIMPMPQIAQAIADGVKIHAAAHPEDAGRGVDGVVANQCLMASLGFADALSHAGVKWLAASPETMVSPGVPSSVAEAIAKHAGEPQAMGAAIVRDVMQQSYGAGSFAWKPAAAFDVLDLDPHKREAVEENVKAFNDAVASRSADGSTIAALRDDARSVRGMVRFSDATPDMPWHADRPALALYSKIANDDRLDAQLRKQAANAGASIRALVTAHAESASFEPFGGSDYRDAIGPTVHFPVTKRSVDPWAPRITETHNAFFTETDAAAAQRVLA